MWGNDYNDKSFGKNSNSNYYDVDINACFTVLPYSQC